MDDHAALRFSRFKQAAERVALRVGKMLLAQKRIAERQSRGNIILPHERQHVPRIGLAEPHAAAAPQAVRRRAIDRRDVAPVVKIRPMRAVKRQKRAVKIIKLKQPRQMIMRDGSRIVHGSSSPASSLFSTARLLLMNISVIL